MSLRRKFILLLVSLSLAVAVNLGTVVWSISFMERELATPLSSFQEVLTGLSNVKRGLGDIHGALAGWGATLSPLIAAAPGPEPARDEAARAMFEQTASRVLADLDTLEANESYRLRAGVSTTRNLRARVTEALDGARGWYRTGDAEGGPPGARRHLIESYFRLHELIERIEQQNLRELDSTRQYSAGLRPTILVILGASALFVALMAWNAAVIMRRLVLVPVARLRLAAERLAAGDLAHRIEIVGKDEIAQLSGEVNHMAETIALMQTERIERERLAAVGEVVRRIVHNLRNPLAGIRGLAEYTRGELGAGSELREAQGRIMQTVDRFERWLVEMLGATRPLQVLPSEQAVGPWLSGVVETHRAAAGARRVELTLDTTLAPETVRFDPRHLEQAVVALVANAIEASPPGGTVAVTVDRGGPGSGGLGWRVLVSDQGVGVPEELRDKIFRPYFTTKPSGSGIGLAIAHQVILQHGGKITVGSPSTNGSIGRREAETASKGDGRGPGAVFTVVLPLAGPAEPGQGG